MADALSITKSANIVKSDPERKYVVVSAPGKVNGEDKITDMLISCYETVRKGGSCADILSKVQNRFNNIIKDLNLKIDLTEQFDKIRKDIDSGANKDYTASRGEYLMALVFADLLGYEFVDAENIIKFYPDKTFDSEYTNDYTAKVLNELKEKGAVVPGFYGRTPDGAICTFSRGGSDVTGSILARAAKADLYENWTDVNGFMMCDPRIVKDPKKIDVLTYKELRELSYMGATVLHPESIFPVRRADIPINIKNTFEPENSGTMIVPSENYTGQNGRIITGIAGKKDFTAIFIEKSMMNSELGFARKALSVLEHYDVSIEHMPTGIDTMSLIIESGNLEGKLDHILARLQAILNPDHIEVLEHISMIATVGHGMSKRKGTAAKLFGALYQAGINIRMIDQGSSELNIIIGVDNNDFEKAIEAIYKAFVL